MEGRVSQLAEALPKAWPASDLPGYRQHPRRFVTYSGFSYDELPPLPELPDEEFHWLQRESPKEKWSLRADDPTFRDRLREIERAANVELRHAFLTFLRSPGLQSRVRSCTACYLQLPDHVVATVGPEVGHLINFLSDQQWCLHWYLHVNRDGEECVLCSPDPYGFDPPEGEGDNEVAARSGPINPAEKKLVFCAPSFSEFMCRFWIENEIWFALSQDLPLNDMQRAYAEHYRSPASSE
jgi:hypothetical protein